MSASSTDSWILIALTILVVLLLFYLSKKMICNNTFGYQEENIEASPVGLSSSSGLESGGTSTSFSDYLGIPPPNLVDGFSQDQEYPVGGDLSTERGTGNWSLGAGYYCRSNGYPYHPRPVHLPGNEDSSISIIISRKDVLEGQLKTQLGRIMDAEKEIQRLVRLLRVEEGMDYSQCLANLPSPSSSPSPVASPVVEATVEEFNSITASTTAPLEDDVHNNIPPPPSTSSTEAVDEAHHHHQNNVGETASPSSSSLSSHSQRLHSESFPLLSDIILQNNNPAGNNRRASGEIGEGQARSVSPEEFPFSSRPLARRQFHPCPCNLSRAAAGANYSRRMLMLQRMFLHPPGMIGRGDFLPRITSSLPYNDAQSYYHHYLLRDPQSHSHHHHHNHHHQQEHHQPSSSSNDDEPPPAYEECIKA